MVSLKYPTTPYWPYSPAMGRGERVHRTPGIFVGTPVVATEKLDGTNTLIHDGKVYARSVAAPSEAKWMAMVKKHHAWKVREPDVYLYGENIYAVHSIEYGPVTERETFYAFALRDERGAFASFGGPRGLCCVEGHSDGPRAPPGAFRDGRRDPRLC